MVMPVNPDAEDFRRAIADHCNLYGITYQQLLDSIQKGQTLAHVIPALNDYIGNIKPVSNALNGVRFATENPDLVPHGPPPPSPSTMNNNNNNYHNNPHNGNHYEGNQRSRARFNPPTSTSTPFSFPPNGMPSFAQGVGNTKPPTTPRSPLRSRSRSPVRNHYPNSGQGATPLFRGGNHRPAPSPSAGNNAAAAAAGGPNSPHPSSSEPPSSSTGTGHGNAYGSNHHPAPSPSTGNNAAAAAAGGDTQQYGYTSGRGGGGDNNNHYYNDGNYDEGEPRGEFVDDQSLVSLVTNSLSITSSHQSQQMNPLTANQIMSACSLDPVTMAMTENSTLDKIEDATQEQPAFAKMATLEQVSQVQMRFQDTFQPILGKQNDVWNEIEEEQDRESDYLETEQKNIMDDYNRKKTELEQRTIPKLYQDIEDEKKDRLDRWNGRKERNVNEKKNTKEKRAASLDMPEAFYAVANAGFELWKKTLKYSTSDSKMLKSFKDLQETFRRNEFAEVKKMIARPTGKTELDKSGASVSNIVGQDVTSVSQVHPLQSTVPLLHQPGKSEYLPRDAFMHMTRYMSNVDLAKMSLMSKTYHRAILPTLKERRGK